MEGDEVLFVGTAEAEHAEMYIKAVWHINEAGGSARATDIAKKLNVRQPSVAHMVKKLKRMNLVSHSRIDGVSLTPEGEQIGAKMVRNSRLLEVLMESALKMDIDEEMVCGVEHHMSPEFTDALCTLLGHPETSPHGKTIPPGDCCLRAAVSPMIASDTAGTPPPEADEEEALFVGTAESEHVEMYVKAVWHINEAGGNARVTDIAKKLNVRQPSVVQMLKKLRRMDLVSHSRLDGVSLTPGGEQIGAKMVRNSRLLEVLMESALKMDIDEEMVCGVEHHMSPRFTDALCTLLGHPRTSPHGKAIPPGDCCGRAA